MKQEEFERFIETWGSMGQFWGINRSMARIHAYILLSEGPVDLDSVSEHLSISRGNASMSLKELRNWGVIKRVHVAGDRKDYYVSEPDMWKMFFRIGIERKKREFDPLLESLRDIIEEGDVGSSEKVSGRLNDMEGILSTMDKVMVKFFESEKKSRTMVGFLKKFGVK